MGFFFFLLLFLVVVAGSGWPWVLLWVCSDREESGGFVQRKGETDKERERKKHSERIKIIIFK